ncbi:fructosamine kinase family protein [Paractinoplanes durhamensis]|uniref:Fructosamine kinase n=1 Tax=Paractinoplanes durhamensis TaxID=113563 RepID=A0ABQ3Z771_9ACTN|nr:fructosamine kinase family protein [Actinoplanes durhamensis]GIE05384.1 fructosamine kinase [Actinoplanes durhamensis]
MDQAYLRAHPEHLPTFLTHQRIRETPVGGGSVSTASRLTLDDGTSLFAKTWSAGDPPPGFFEAEASGLRWLAEAGIPTPELLVALPQILALEWIDTGPATPQAAERLGRALAALHDTPADTFGAPWPGFIGPLPLDNTPHRGPWPAWFAERRLLPYLKASTDNGALTPPDAVHVGRVLDRLAHATDDEPPCRTHGDLWPGNILWSDDGRPYLIDPAAHGAHRETDLANLHLFGGAPHLDSILAAYQEVHPLADGWRARIPLHQLHLLLVHTAAFGASYRTAVVTAATNALQAL